MYKLTLQATGVRVVKVGVKFSFMPTVKKKSSSSHLANLKAGYFLTLIKFHSVHLAIRGRMLLFSLFSRALFFFELICLAFSFEYINMCALGRVRLMI
jgi:hypothetical protein